METYEIELITDEENCDAHDLVGMCAPGWCGPVDGFMMEKRQDIKQVN